MAGLELRVGHSAFRTLAIPSFLGLTNILYPHLWQDFPVEPASDHVICPQLTHLYRISRGSIGELQWLHCSSPVGLYSLLSVRLQFLHLWRMVWSVFIRIVPAT